MLIDTHAHVFVKDFDHDRDVVIQRAHDAGIAMLHVGFEPDGNEKAMQLAQRYGEYFTVGIHPHHADLATSEQLGRMEQVAKSPAGARLVALGETGLDFFKNRQPPDVQRRAFRSQLKLARKLDLPVIIHCREAFEDVFEILDEEKPHAAVFHCFTGTLQQANECWGRGCLTSFTGICTYPGAKDLRSVIAAAPLEKIMIETDAPFLGPQSHRGQRNEPVFLKETFEKIAEIRKIPSLQLEEILEKTTRDFFKIGNLVIGK